MELDRVAAELEGLEETIILRLIDRAQFHVNTRAYRAGESGFSGEPESSLFELRLRHHEEMDAQFGRYRVPEERPFTSGLPASRREVVLRGWEPRVSSYDAVNLTGAIRSSYMDFLPRFCPPGDDAQYGSSVEHDVHALQAVSRRIHYGAFYVAEAKYRSDAEGFAEMIASGDVQALAARLTRPEVEERVLRRVRAKVEHIQAGANPSVRVAIPAEVVVEFYSRTVIPLTKEGEVRYLLGRER